MRLQHGQKFRRAEEADLVPCTALFLDVFNGPPWNENWDRDSVLARLADCLKTPGFRGWVVEQDDGALCSFALGYCEPYNRQVHYFLKEMCVHSARQRQGIGRALMTHVTAELQAEGVHRVYLLTARESSAEVFYRNCGFYVSPRMIMMGRRLTETGPETGTQVELTA